MPTMSEAVEIGAGPELVWSILADVSRLPKFSRSTTDVDVDGALRARGQSFEQTVRLGGRSWTSQWEVDRIDPGQLLQISGTLPLGAPYTMTERLAPIGSDRSRLEVSAEYDLPMGALGRLAGRLGVERRARAELRDVVRGVARLAEAEAEAEAGTATRAGDS